MFARVVRVSLGSSDPQQGAGSINERVVPAVRQMPGVKQGYWLLNREKGEAMGVILFEDEASLRASTQQTHDMRTRAEQEGLGTTQGIDEYEVIAQL